MERPERIVLVILGAPVQPWGVMGPVLWVLAVLSTQFYRGATRISTPTRTPRHLKRSVEVDTPQQFSITAEQPAFAGFHRTGTR